MKKTIIIILFLITLTGCASDKNQTQETPKKPNTEQSEQILNKEIVNKIINTQNSNYNFIYDISIWNNSFYYEGTYYDNIINGNYIRKVDGKTTTYAYQIEDDKCYNLKNKQEMYNVFHDVNVGFIDLKHLSNTIDNNKTRCSKNGLNYECSVEKDNEKIIYQFVTNEDYLNHIKITQNSNDVENIYTITYSNINNTSKIAKVNDYIRFDIKYDKTNDEQIVDAVTEKFIFYKLENVIFKIDNNPFEINSTTINKIIEKKQYQKNFSDSITKYVFENNIIIYQKEIEENSYIFYISTEEYNNEILHKLVKNNLN